MGEERLFSRPQSGRFYFPPSKAPAQLSRCEHRECVWRRIYLSREGVGMCYSHYLLVLTLTITLKCVKLKIVNLYLHFKPGFYEKDQMDHALNSDHYRSSGGYGNQFQTSVQQFASVLGIRWEILSRRH
jgi:hypothetical protein